MLHGAIIGIGKIAQTAHLPAFRDGRICDQAAIVAAVDPSKESREIAAKLFPELRFYETTQQLFNEEKIDFIDICAPPKFHGELIEIGIEQDVHILCEKPFSTSLQEADHITALLKKESQLVFMPCHQYRYFDVWQLFKAFLDDDIAGLECFLQFNVFRLRADQGLSSWNPSWRTDPCISGGGILVDIGIHYLYLSLWMLGMPLNLTAAVHRIRHSKYSVEDTAIVLLEFERGVAQINLTWGADRRVNNARLVSQNGSVTYDGNSLVRYRHEEKESLPVLDTSNKSYYVSLYVSLIDEFLQRVHRRQGSAQWIDEAYQSIAVLQACYLSAEAKRAICLNSDAWKDDFNFSFLDWPPSETCVRYQH
ncbi:Gfo/Idh/MocA family oxidoreductase [Candidatus Poribacteria bacterium]|nr:Gfo/Idh/MocA family oxidoreductase [Candidatus Poribacteria bacterium]